MPGKICVYPVYYKCGYVFTGDEGWNRLQIPNTTKVRVYLFDILIFFKKWWCRMAKRVWVVGDDLRLRRQYFFNICHECHEWSPRIHRVELCLVEELFSIALSANHVFAIATVGGWRYAHGFDANQKFPGCIPREYFQWKVHEQSANLCRVCRCGTTRCSSLNFV